MFGARWRGDTCPWIYVQAEEGGDWSALLCSRSMSSFVDVYSPQDFYPQKMWQAAEMYFESLDDAHMVLPGGRQVRARWGWRPAENTVPENQGNVGERSCLVCKFSCLALHLGKPDRFR